MKQINPKSKIQNPKSKVPLLLVTLVVALGLDQLTKALVVANIAGHPPVSVIEGFARLRYTENTGAAFGFFQGWTGLLSVAAIAIIAVIMLQAPKVSTSVLGMIALGLITGGALGNLVDRLRLGHVVDFFEVYGPSLNINNIRYTFPVFNVADSAITVGAILLMATLLFGKDTPVSAPATEDTSHVDAVTDNSIAQSSAVHLASQIQKSSPSAQNSKIQNPKPAGWAGLMVMLAGLFLMAFRQASKRS